MAAAPISLNEKLVFLERRELIGKVDSTRFGLTLLTTIPLRLQLFVTFTPVIFHPNVYTLGRVCPSILTSEWTPAISVKEILIGVQDLLDSPNENDPANGQANTMYVRSKAKYKKRVQEEARKHKPLEAL